MGKMVSMLTKALPSVNKGHLVPGRHIKTLQGKKIGLAEWDPSCCLEICYILMQYFWMDEKVKDNCCRKSQLSCLGNAGGTLNVQVCRIAASTCQTHFRVCLQHAWSQEHAVMIWFLSCLSKITFSKFCSPPPSRLPNKIPSVWVHMSISETFKEGTGHYTAHCIVPECECRHGSCWQPWITRGRT